MNIRMKISLRDLRKESNLKTSDIISELDIQPSTLYSWENGQRLIPINQLHKLLTLYQYPISDFDFEHLIQIYEEKNRVNING